MNQNDKTDLVPLLVRSAIFVITVEVVVCIIG